MCTIKVLDVELNDPKVIPTNFFFITSLESFSQLSIGNWLYLCGEYGNLDNGSIFLKFDLLSSLNDITMMVNSIHRHYKPSMAFFKKDYIVVIGGRKNLKCEIYHKSSNKWRTLPDLPEERFGSCLINDDKQDSVYLFGGYCHQTKSNCSSLLKINLKSGITWETLVVVNNSSLIARSFANGIKTDKFKILLFGGSTNSQEYSDEIIEFDMFSKTPTVSDLKLQRPSKFNNNSLANVDVIFYLIDDEDYIHKVNYQENRSYCNNPFEEISANDININNNLEEII